MAAGWGWQGCPGLASRRELVLGSGEPWRGSACYFTENNGEFFFFLLFPPPPSDLWDCSAPQKALAQGHANAPLQH